MRELGEGGYRPMKWDGDQLALVRAAGWQLQREGVCDRGPSAEAVREALIRSENLSRVAQDHKMLGVVQLAAAELLPETETYRRLRQSTTATRLSCLRSIGTIATIQRSLRNCGIRSMSIKGPALAAQSCGDWAARGVGDIDILVSPSDLDRTIDFLLREGGNVRDGRSALDVRHGGEHEFIHAVTCSFAGLAIDVHTRLDEMPSVLEISHYELWVRRTTIEIAGAEVTTLGLVDATLLVAAHAGRDSWSHVGSIVDFARLLAQVSALGRVPELCERAARCGGSSRLLLALQMLRPWSSGIPDQGPLPRMLARNAWDRLASARNLRRSDDVQDVLTSNAFRYLSAGPGQTPAWWLRRLQHLPSVEGDMPLGAKPNWVYAMASPYLDGQRLLQRRSRSRRRAAGRR